jgi:4-hydroxybutyrate dehydrogenase
LNDGRKLGFISPHLIPKRAVCDPELTVGLPPLLTAATGMDAVTHSIETFLSPRDNPPAEAIALDGLARGVAHLERAVANGGDLHARKEMMMAALEGGLTFQKGLGAVHSLSHALGALSDLALHHGTLNAVLLPAVLRFNEPAAGEKYERIRRALGLAAGVDLARFIEDLNGRLGLPRNLRAMGVPREALPGVAEAAVADHSTPSNARFVDAAAFEDLLQGAY